MNIKSVFCTLVIMTTMVLAGCGGGGGGGGLMTGMMETSTPTPEPPTPPPPPTAMLSVSVFGDLMSPTQVIADNVVTAIGKAAEAKPRAGSVTQSSNVDNVTSRPIRGKLLRSMSHTPYAVFQSGTEQNGRSIVLALFRMPRLRGKVLS